MFYKDYEVVIGLEIHAQLSTSAKLFSRASTKFESNDNENATAVCLGFPGTLPVINEEAVRKAVIAGLALKCEIALFSSFDRKQYFYPDLSKGYQISQLNYPLCNEGKVDFYLDGEKRSVRIERAHMEEDAGKSTHHGDYTLINYNRAGIPLLEIVSAPEMKSPQEAAQYARTVRSILKNVGVCDGNLEEGSLRCDCNVSVKKVTDKDLGTKVELKNINSFRFIEKAIDYEAQRQIDLLESGKSIAQETRLYDSTKNVTISMRSKEEADDYRYFPDADLRPIVLTEEYVSRLKNELPPGPTEKYEQYVNDLGISPNDAVLISSESEFSALFESAYKESNSPVLSANWIVGEFFRMLNEDKIEVADAKVDGQKLGQLVALIESGEISGKIAKEVFSHMWTEGSSPQEIIEKKGLKQVSDESTLISWVDEVLNDHSEKVQEYKAGKDKLFGFFVGQIMKKSKGKASPELVNKLLVSKLKDE